jgi:protein ImuB
VFGGLHAPRPLPEAGALLAIARSFTPRVEARAPTPVLLDLSGLGRLWPTPHELGRALIAAAAAKAIEAQAALAFTRGAALVVARGCPGLNVVPAGGEAAALAPLPIALLELPQEQQELLARWGLRTIGDLAQLPPAALAARLGPAGPRLVGLARGEDARVFQKATLPERFETTLELDWPVDGLEPLAFLLQRALDPLGEALAARGVKAGALAFELGLADGSVHARTLRPAAPSGDARTWRTLVLLDLEAHPPRDAITRLTLRAEPTPARASQFSLLDPAQPAPEKLAETLARLHAWTEAGRSGSPRLLDTHRPGAFAVSTFAPGPLPRGGRAFGPSVPRVALRAYRPPRLAHVLTKAGVPSFVAAPGLRGAVTAAAGPWRVSGDWWDESFSREEWDVSLAAQPGPSAPGAAFRIFRDRLRGEWFVEGELD